MTIQFLVAQTKPDTVLRQEREPFRFLTGDSLVFRLRNYSCYDPGSIEKLVFVRQEECIAVSLTHADFANQSPMIREQLSISYPFLKDTLFSILRNIKKQLKEGRSTDRYLYMFLLNGKPITINEPKLEISNQKNKIYECCTFEAPDSADYLNYLLSYLKESLMTKKNASCDYKPPLKMPEQGEN